MLGFCDKEAATEISALANVHMPGTYVRKVSTASPDSCPTAPANEALIDLVLPVSKSLRADGAFEKLVIRIKNKDGSVDRQLNGKSPGVEPDANDPDLLNFRFNGIPSGNYAVLSWTAGQWLTIIPRLKMGSDALPNDQPPAAATISKLGDEVEDDADEEKLKDEEDDDEEARHWRMLEEMREAERGQAEDEDSVDH